jgi:hypothetical protein
VLDLVTPFAVATRQDHDRAHQGRAARALERLGEAAVDLLERIHAAVASGAIAPELLALDAR